MACRKPRQADFCMIYKLISTHMINVLKKDTRIIICPILSYYSVLYQLFKEKLVD